MCTVLNLSTGRQSRPACCFKSGLGWLWQRCKMLNKHRQRQTNLWLGSYAAPQFDAFNNTRISHSSVKKPWTLYCLIKLCFKKVCSTSWFWFLIQFFFQQIEVKQLETDIGQLRGACDDMSKRVTHLTAGKGKRVEVLRVRSLYWKASDQWEGYR